MSFYNGLLNLTNWAGNVIMPTLGALFIAFAVVQFARGYHHLYSTWAYGGLMCLMVSGLLRMFEKFTGQLGWNNPDLYWNSLLNMVDWFANVILPVYAGTAPSDWWRIQAYHQTAPAAAMPAMKL
jgi:hypothetical protein